MWAVVEVIEGSPVDPVHLFESKEEAITFADDLTNDSNSLTGGIVFKVVVHIRQCSCKYCKEYEKP